MASHGTKPKPEFYRRVLPDGCIAFSSTEGKTIFREALVSGHMGCYFKMASQFSTQAEPAFCGLTTLVMILNALEVDPGKVWKGPWRWYHEDMLECCVSLDVMKENGITFDQFVCLAACNSLEGESTRMDDSASLETFRNHVTRLSRNDDRFIALSYSRKILGQTGDGHFSPVGGYHPDRDMVLVMDTARFKYPPHWVPLTTIWEAMKPLDKSTGKPRGYCILSKINKDGSLRLFKLSKSFNVFLPCACTSGISSFLYKWREGLAKEVAAMTLEGTDEKIPSDDMDIFDQVLPLLLKSAGCIAQHECILSTFMDLANFSKEHNSLKEALLQQIECLDLYNIVHDVLQNADIVSDSCLSIGNAGENKVMASDEGCCGVSSAKCAKNSDTRMIPAHFITVFVLCWPYESFKDTEAVTIADTLDAYIIKWMESTTSKELKEEVSQLKRQLSVLLKMRSINHGVSCNTQCKAATSCSNLCETTTSFSKNK
ncbi:glutathione gamma-glutamylcysteinyltransferase 2-like [Mizuhopecten yessoensis]|uniref:glutathione gamma-glutamylcysteinyltransferase n=1 Tax=Mizuhopecten yessoensis TaxID=6573 RepID=A0A210Q594_MIZYE|nr:glutathione gamma-glutamylcysteinyltransferase 2-like [Mizuhopecten yessoensis]OWF43910.1 Glutathione gamma-glutamylcysteinyltransferase 2 [Mizuhopecten yessoensis]